MNIRVAKMFIEKVLHFTPSTNKVVFLWLTLLYPTYNWGCNPLRIPRVNHGKIIKPSIIYNITLFYTKWSCPFISIMYLVSEFSWSQPDFPFTLSHYESRKPPGPRSQVQVPVPQALEAEEAHGRREALDDHCGRLQILRDMVPGDGLEDGLNSGTIWYDKISWYGLIYVEISWYILISLDKSWYVLIYADISWYILIRIDMSW